MVNGTSTREKCSFEKLKLDSKVGIDLNFKMADATVPGKDDHEDQSDGTSDSSSNESNDSGSNSDESEDDSTDSNNSDSNNAGKNYCAC